MDQDSNKLSQALKIVSDLNEEERKQLLEWLQFSHEEKELSALSFISSHSAIEKDWQTPEEDKAWENL